MANLRAARIGIQFLFVMERRVLIVDDDEVLCALIACVVRVAGWAPVTATNGAIACDVLSAQPHPDVILFDLLMPIVNGWQFRARQLANPHSAQISVVVLSGTQAADRAMRADAVVAKPFTFDHLLTTLRRVVTRGDSDDHDGAHAAGHTHFDAAPQTTAITTPADRPHVGEPVQS
jgi:CheY-like chemotaxis protein